MALKGVPLDSHDSQRNGLLFCLYKSLEHIQNFWNFWSVLVKRITSSKFPSPMGGMYGIYVNVGKCTSPIDPVGVCVFLLFSQPNTCSRGWKHRPIWWPTMPSSLLQGFLELYNFELQFFLIDKNPALSAMCKKRIIVIMTHCWAIKRNVIVAIGIDIFIRWVVAFSGCFSPAPKRETLDAGSVWTSLPVVYFNKIHPRSGGVIGSGIGSSFPLVEMVY